MENEEDEVGIVMRFELIKRNCLKEGRDPGFWGSVGLSGMWLSGFRTKYKFCGYYESVFVLSLEYIQIIVYVGFI